MKVNVTPAALQKVEVDTLLLYLWEGDAALAGEAAALDTALNGSIGEVRASGDFSGKTGETLLLFSRGAIPARRILLVGAGKAESFDSEAARMMAASGMKYARKIGSARAAAYLPQGAQLAGAFVEGALLSLYQFEELKLHKEPKTGPESLTLIVDSADQAEQIGAEIQSAVWVSEAVMRARDLVNLPAQIATPTYLADQAQQIAQQYGLKIEVGDRQWAEDHQMGAFLGVARGATEEPRFIILEHNANRSDLNTIVLVGKGVTFDSGGLSIKPVDRMGEMKSDMAGAAAVLGAMQAAAALNLPLHLVGLMPCSENMPDGSAYHPGDVLTASNGKSIEIISTDAEGRLLLADALWYARRYQPNLVIDLATLTGACVIALGDGRAAGLFATDSTFQDKLVRSGQNTFERLWPLPLWDEYKSSIRSDVADLKNSGGRYGGVSTSAIFLKEFTDFPWAHIDMAPMALALKEESYIPVGGTGFGVRLLVDFLKNW